MSAPLRGAPARGFSFRQRLPAGAMRIIEPARETRLAVGFALVYVAVSAVTGLIQRVWPHPLWGATSLTADATYAIGFKICLLLTLPALAIRAAGYRWEDLLLGWRASPRAVGTLAIGFALGALINAGLLGPIRAATEALPPAEALARIVTGGGLALLSAGIPEELVYRWGLQTRLERSWGRSPAIVATAVLFTAWHLPTRYLLASGVEGTASDLGSVLAGTGAPVLVVGLLFGLAWDRWRNLPMLIAVHWGIDVLPSVASLVGIDR